MYRIIGEDGKEYGPVTLDQLQQWIAQGRVRPKTRCKADGAGQWSTAAEIPEVAQMLSGGKRSGTAPGLPAGQKPKKGLAWASLIFGVSSLSCLPVVGAIPAIICGHIAKGRVKRAPGTYQGAGLALAGLVLGYLSVIGVLLSLPFLVKEVKKSQVIDCKGNLQALSVALQSWAMDHDNKFPFQVSTNEGGSLEWVKSEKDGDGNSSRHFTALGQALETPKVLVCPGDHRKPARSLDTLTPDQVTYRMFTDKEVNPDNPQSIVLVCPIHGTAVTADGTLTNSPAK